MAKRTITCLLLAALLICGWTAEAAICTDENGNPIPCEQDPGPSMCANDPFEAYWSGYVCGNSVWNPVSCSDCVNASSDGCITKPSDGAGGCFYQNGQCYGWGSCHYTG